MKKHILIVDDDRQIRLSLKYVLGREGYDISEAGDGYAALQKIGADHDNIDLVLMDIIMPKKEGIQTILELRDKYPELKIIAMSGGARLNTHDPLKLARDCGANFVISKPFDPPKLRALVKMCL